MGKTPQILRNPVALKSGSGWIYIDDLCVSVRRFLSFQEVLYSYPDGCFFAIFQKSESVDINLHESANQVSTCIKIL